jgi:hypothetical protein
VSLRVQNGSSSSDSESTTNHRDKVATSDDPSEKEDEPESLTESHDEGSAERRR